LDVAGEKKIDIDFEKEFASYNPIFADRVVSYKGLKLRAYKR
jgi:UDP-N-acetylmuramate--alanine ligase